MEGISIVESEINSLVNRTKKSKNTINCGI